MSGGNLTALVIIENVPRVATGIKIEPKVAMTSLGTHTVPRVAILPNKA